MLRSLAKSAAPPATNAMPTRARRPPNAVGRPRPLRVFPISILRGLIGAVRLTSTSNQTFSILVPFLILFATVLFLAQGLVRRLTNLDARRWRSGQRGVLWGAVLFQFAVAIY